jgi:hypothetical protein
MAELHARSACARRAPRARQGLCVPPCPEVTIGLYLYRLILTNCASINLVDILVTGVRKLIRRPAIYDAPSVPPLTRPGPPPPAHEQPLLGSAVYHRY